MSPPNSGLLVDTGFFFALYDERDDHHGDALEKQEWLGAFGVVLPWPVLHETINTRFARRSDIMVRFDAVVSSGDTFLVDDSPYRDRAYGRTVTSSQRGEPVSLVDAILQAIIGDVNIPIAAMLTFNRRDFAAVCARHSVELL